MVHTNAHSLGIYAISVHLFSGVVKKKNLLNHKKNFDGFSSFLPLLSIKQYAFKCLTVGRVHKSIFNSLNSHFMVSSQFVKLNLSRCTDG